MFVFSLTFESNAWFLIPTIKQDISSNPERPEILSS